MRNKAYTIISIAILCVLVWSGYLWALSCSININNGATYTISRSVTLNLSASGGEGNKYMRFNNDGGSWTSWESFGTSKSWTLNDSDGTRTVYFEVKDSSSTPNVDSDNDSIILDRINPVTSVYYDEGKGDNGWYIYVYVTLDPYDTTSGVNYTGYKVGGTWKTHYGESDFSFYLPDGASQEAEFYSVDNAGNQESHRYTDKKNVDGTKPVTTISLSGTAGDNGWYTSNVTVSLSASDATSEVNWIKYKIGFFGEEMTYQGSFTISDDGGTTVYYWAKDVAGNEEWSNSINIKIDTTKPNAAVMNAEPKSGYTPGTSNTISWNAVSDSTSDNVTYFVQCDDNEDFSSPYAQSVWITGTSYTFSGLKDGTKYWYRVKAKDGAGLQSEWSDKVSSIQDATDPEITIESPEDGFSSDEYKVSIVTVTLSDNLWCYKLTINLNGSFYWSETFDEGTMRVVNKSTDVALNQGMNDITLIVEDRAGNSNSASIKITYGIYIKDHFKFHYTTSPRYPIKIYSYVGRDDHVDNTDTDGNRIPDYVDDFASIFSYVWNYETGFMGRQPLNGYYGYNTGGILDSEYNVYIVELSASAYGWCSYWTNYSHSSSPSYIVMDNDYAGFSGSQSDNMKVTTAHEFFHAIQFTIDVDEDDWWMETTAVWMEDYVYDSINDYLQYLESWFGVPESSLDSTAGSHEYGSVIFAKYLSENYGSGSIKDIWDGCAGSTQSLDAIQNALSTHGGLEDNFKTFTYWNYDKENYDEGSLYRGYPTKIEFSHYNYPLTRSEEIDHLASNYIEFLPDPRIPTDATTTQNLHLEISTTTALWGGKVLKVDRAGEVVDVVNLASGEKMDIKGLGSNSTDKYSKIILVLSNTNTGGSAEPYTYDAFTSAVKYDSDRVLDPLRSGTSPKIYAKMVQDGLYSSESGESYSEDSEDVDDWFGNDDGNIDAGESPSIKVTLENLGSVDIVNATAIITPDSQSSEYIDFSIFNEDSYPDTMVPYGGTAEGWRGYWGSVSADTPLGQDLYFTLDITDQYGINYDDKFTINDVDLDIHPRFPLYFTNDGNNLENGEWGNNNGNADAGELLAVPLSLFNDGYSNIRRDGYYQDMGLHDKYNHYLVATLSTMDSYVKRIFDDSEKFEDILSYLSGQTLGSYNFLIRSSAPPGDSISFTLAIRDVVTDVDGNSHIYDWEDQFDVAVTGGDTVPPLIGGVDIVNVPDAPILKEGDKVKFTTDILDGSDKVSRKGNILYPDNSVHTVNVDKTSPVWNGYYERIIDYWQLPLSTGTLHDGTYTIQSLIADDGYGNVSSMETNKNIEIDTELPVTILNELANKYISKQTEIIGTAKDVHLSRYRLYYAPGENLDPDDTSINWTLIAESDSSVENSTLGIWDTTLVTGGPYTLKLWAEDEVLHTNQDTLNVIVDNTPPEISNAYASPFVFTPEDRDGFRDITTLYGSISDNLSPEFTFRVKIVEREEGTVVVSLADETTQAKNFSFIWDGKNEAGEFVQDGLYYFNITGIDLAGNESTVNVPVTKNRAPSRIDSPQEGVEVGDIVDISGLAVDYVDFKNFILDYASGSFDISNEEETSWMAIPVPVINQAKADPNYPYSNISVIQCNEGILANWNTIGLDDGEYTIRLKVNDYAGDIQKVFRHVMVKNPLYLYNVSPSNEVFSPNGDGIQDTVVVKYTLSEEAGVGVEVIDSSGTIRKSYFTEKNLPKGEHTITWDGKDNGGEIVEDGKYEIKIVADAIAPDGGRKEAIESIIVNNFQRVPDLTADISSPAEGSDVQTALGIHYTWEAEGTGREYPDQKFDYIITAVGTETLPPGGHNTERVHLHKGWSIFHSSEWGSFDIYLSNPEKYRNRGPVQWQREVIKSEHVEYVRHTAYDDHLHIYAKVYSNFWGDGCYMADYNVWAPEKQISWTRSQSGTGKVNALEGEKLIAESNLTAPNNDTRWFLWHNNSNVGAWMKDNKLYATTGVSELWSTVKVPGGDNIFELSVSSRTEKIEYIPPMSNVRVDRWKVKLLDGEGNENKDIVVESIDFSNGTFVTKLEGNPASRSLVKIEGTAASPNLEYYRVESGSSDDIYSWTTIKESNRQVINGTLAVWDVTDLKEGAYVVLLTVVDKGGDVKQVYKRVNLNIPLIITYEEPDPNPFSPQYEETKLKFNLSEEARVTVRIKKDTTIMKELVSEKLMKLGNNELEWDGRDTEGNIVPDGIYDCEIMATDTDLDINGNPLEQATVSIPNIQVEFLNKKLEPLNLIAKPNPFSPDGDGVKESVNITYNLSERANVRLLVRNPAGIVRTLLDNVEEPQGLRSVNWDGKLVDGTTIVPAGKYTCWIGATSLDDTSDIREESIELTVHGASTANITAQILEPTADNVVDRTSSNAGTFFTYEVEGTGTKYPEQAFSYTINAIGAEEINVVEEQPVYHDFKSDEYAPALVSGSNTLTDGSLRGWGFYTTKEGWRHITIHFKDWALINEVRILSAPSPPFTCLRAAEFKIEMHTLDGWKVVQHLYGSGEDPLIFVGDQYIKFQTVYADMVKMSIKAAPQPQFENWIIYFWLGEIAIIGPWSGSQNGAGEVSAVDGHKYITTSTLRAPNSDTSWTVTDNSDTVITWMEGNKLYARVDTTKPGTVIPNWSTGKIYSKNPNLLIFDPNNPDVVPSLHLNVFDVYTRPSDVEFESWQITPLNADGSANTDVMIENINAVNGTFDAKLNLKEQRKFLQIKGTAAGGDFKSYTIEYGRGSEPDEWISIKPSVSPVTDSTLAYWDIGRLYGSYILLLTVEDTAGNVKELKRNIQVGELVTQGISDFAATPYEETHLYFSPDTLPISIEDDYPLTPEKDALVSAIPIAPEDVPEDPNIVIVGPVFDFKPSGLGFNENFPVTLNSQYTIERLQEMLGNVDPSKLGIYQFYPDGTVEYRPSFVDKETQMVAITAQIPHFSQYIMALDLTPPAIPVLDPIKSPTNEKLAKVTGTSEPEATIEVFSNGKSQGKVSTDNEAKFSLAVVELEEGDNIITTIATNKKGISSEPVTVSVKLDRLTPVLLAVDVSPGIFSPNGDGVDDVVNIIAKLSEPGSVNYTIFDSSGRVVLVRNLETEDEDTTYFSWDGLTSGGERASDGIYSYHISGIDSAGNKATENSLSNGIIKLDTTPPEILNVSSHPLSFSPDGDGVQDEVSIDYEIKDNLCSSYYLTVRIYDESGNLVRLLKNREPLPLGANRVVWDGSDEIGNIVNDGNYTVRLDFVDAAGNQGREVSITVKLDNASVLDFSKTKVEPESFSPDDNGKQDTCSISCTLLSPGKVTLRIVTPESMTPIKELIVNKDLDTGSYIMSWDGKDDEGNIVADGIYECKLSAISQAGKESQVALFVNVDNTPPVAKISQPSSDATLNGTIDIEGTVSDENYSGYSLTYGQGTSPESWTLLFSSSEPVTSSSLASWDTAGLSGTYSIRLRVVDDAGNQAEDKVSFNLDNSEKYIIRLLPTSSNLFSPDEDGVKDELSIIYFLEEDALMGLWVYDENNILVRTLLDGTTVQTSGYNGVRWDGRGDNGDPLPDGAYSYTIQAVSVSEGFKDERLGNAIIDTLSPTVSITSPKEGDVIGGTIGIFGTANDVAFSGYRMEYGSGDSPQEWKEIKTSANPVTDGLLSYFDTSGLDNGIYTLRLTAEDRAGNQAIVKVSLSVNNSPIVARIETPVWDEILGGEIRVIGTAQAPDLDYYQLEYSTDSFTYQPITGKINTAVNGGLLATWDTSGINGSCSLRLSVQDKSGRSRSISVSIKIDNTSPAVEIKSPKESATLWGTISIIGTASDENLEKYSLEYRNATSNDSWQSIGIYMAPINDATLGFWNTEGLNGDYLIKLKAIDRANNTNEVVTRITIDNRLPVVRIDEPENNSVLKGKVDITGGASDPYFDKYAVTCAQGPSFDEWKSILISTVPVTDGLLAGWDTTSLNGTYSVRLRIYNRKGKVNEDKIVVFVDNTPPIITNVSANPSIFDPNNSKANFTTISYTLSEDAKVTLSIRDGDGRLVRQLVSSSPKAKGVNSSVWDGKDDSRATLDYGDYIYEIEASDLAGNLADKIEGTIKLSLDLPPATVITPSGPIYSDGRGNFAPMSYTYTLTGINTDDISVSQVNYIQFNLDNGGWETYVSTSPLSFTNEGEHSIKYKSVDTNSNWEDAKEFRVIVDSTPPESHIQISPPRWQEMENGVLYVGSSTKFNLLASDGGTIPSGVLKREYRINGGDWQEYIGPFNLEVVDGSYTIEYRAIDNVQNVEGNKSLQVILDSNAPASSVVVSEPRYSDDRGVWISSSTLVSLSAEDGSGSGVKFTQYKIDSGNEKTYTGSFALISEGSHVVTYRSEDNLGNIATAKSITLLVDRSPPIIDISIGVPKYGTEPVYVSSQTAITLIGQDGAGCGIDKIQYSVDKGETWIVYTSSFTITQSGMVSIQYKSMDRVKNVGEMKTINVFVDNTPPVTTFVPSEPLYEGLYALYAPLSTTYSLSGEDPLTSGGASGMAKVEYKINDSELMEYDEPFPLPAGGHIITCYGTDNVANIEEVRPFEVIVDTTSPHTVLIPSGKLYNDGTNDFAPLSYTYTLKAVQGISGVDHIEFSVDGGNWEVYSNPISFSTGGEHTIKYRAVSNTGNWEKEKELFKVIVDGKPPEVVVLFPSDRAYIKALLLKAIEVKFSEYVSSSSTNGWGDGLLIKEEKSGNLVSGTFAYDSKEDLLTFTSSLKDHTVYSIKLTSEIRDRVGNPLKEFSSSFTTLMLKEKGGKVEEGEVRLDIPPDALPQDAVIIINKEEDEIVNKIPRPLQSLEKDKLYHIVAYNQDHQEIQQKLKKQMGMKISYGKESKSQTKDSSKVEKNSVNPKTLRLYWYNPQKERWEKVENSKNNFSVKEVIAQVERFGRYSLMGFIPFGDSLEGLSNYPNPFPAFGKDYTTIQYYLKDDADVAIAIYDLMGNLVKIFEINSGEEGGRGGELNKVEWDGRNGRGDMVANGGYICRVQIDDGKRVKSKIRKILIIK